MTYTGHEVVWGRVPRIIEAHEMIRSSAMPNFMKVRIPVQTQLNVEAWKKYLDLYRDKQLINLIQFGFLLDFDRNNTLQSNRPFAKATLGKSAP